MGLPFLVGILISFAIGAIQMGINYLLMALQPEPYKMPSPEAVDPGLQFTAQYNTRTSQVPIPLIFGTVRMTGNILYENIGGASNDFLFTCIGIGESALVASIGNVYIDDVLWEDLPYATFKEEGMFGLKSSLTKKTAGGVHQFFLSSEGEHGLGFMSENIIQDGEEIEEHISYPMTLYGDDCSATIKVTLYKGYEVIHFSYDLWCKKTEESEWFCFGSFNGAEATWNYNGDEVPHLWQYEYPTGALTPGEWQFKLTVRYLHWHSHVEQKDDTGEDTWSFSSWIRFDSVVLYDSGASDSLSFPQTAYLAIAIRRDDAMPASAVIQADVTGTYSNPAECIYQLLTNAYWGHGIPTDYICTTCYNAAVAFCDTWSYTFNRCVGGKMSLRDLLNEMLMAGRLMILDYDGQIHIVPDDDSASVKTITDDSIVDLQYSRQSLMNSPTRIVGKFNDASEDYTVQDVIVDDQARQDIRGYVKEMTIDLTGVTDRQTAQQLAIFTMWKLSNDELVMLKTSINNSDLKPGDVFKLTSLDAGWVEKPMRVIAIDEDEDMDVTLTCQPHYPDMYNTLPKTTYTGDQILDVFNPVSPVFPTALPNASNIVISDEIYNVGENITADLVITFTKPVAMCDYVEIWLSRGTYGVNMPNEYKKIGESDGEFIYTVEEFFVQHIFRLVTVYKGQRNEVLHSAAILAYPEPMTAVGYGAGNYGIVWYGY